MGLFGKKDEQQGEVWKVESTRPRDKNNVTTIYAPSKEEAERQAEKLRQRETHVKVRRQ